MTRLEPNGWEVKNTDQTQVIELVRKLDKGEYAEEVIRAERSQKDGIWQLHIYETTHAGGKNTVRNKRYPQSDRSTVINHINKYTGSNSGDQY